MTPPPSAPLSSLQLDWLNALHYALPVLRSEVRTLATDVAILPGDPKQVWLGSWEVIRPAGFGEPRTLALAVHIDPALPEIERIEMNLALVSNAAWFFRYGTLGEPSELRHDLCKRLGCFHTNINRPRPRWLQLAMHTNTDELPYARLETRLRCPICPSTIATGASAFDCATQPDEINAPNSTRRDIHYECWKYLHHTLAPQIRAMREARSAGGAAEKGVSGPFSGGNVPSWTSDGTEGNK